jgi:hypothetical protein
MQLCVVELVELVLGELVLELQDLFSKLSDGVTTATAGDSHVASPQRLLGMLLPYLLKDVVERILTFCEYFFLCLDLLRLAKSCL